jgi:hypothetical protein
MRKFWVSYDAGRAEPDWRRKTPKTALNVQAWATGSSGDLDRPAM